MAPNAELRKPCGVTVAVSPRQCCARSQVAMEVGAVANTPAARRALEAYRALQRRSPQPTAGAQHSFEVRQPFIGLATLLRGCLL